MDSVVSLIAQFNTFTLVLLGIIALLTLYFHGPVFSAHTAHNAPSILTSLGIFGTFLGVAFGLMGFDTNSIQASVPALIEGLKTAFWTSIAGLFGALTIKFRYSMVMIRKGNQVRKQGATFEDVVQGLDRVANQLSLPGKHTFAEVSVRQQHEFGQKLQAMGDALNAYQKDMAEANTEAFIGAINRVMRDFNARIDEQYGDNFKQLNDSVGRMLHWQQRNREQLEEISAQQKAGAIAMVEATDAFSTLVGQTSAFSDVAANMETMLTSLREQSGAMGSFMERLSQLVVNAQAGLPDLEKRVSQLTDVLYNSIDKSQHTLSASLTATSAEISLAVQRVNENLTTAVRDSQLLVNDQLENLLEQNNRRVNELDQAMEAELTKALKTFGYQLTALSEKFVNDYTPLTDKLQELLRVAELES